LKYKEKENLSLDKKQLLGESALAFASLSRRNIVVPHEMILVLRAFNVGFSVVYDGEALFFYSSYYYAYRDIKNNDVEISQKRLKKTNLDTMAMQLKIKAFEMNLAEIGNSTDDYFFSRMERLLWAIQYIMRNGQEELYLPAIYNLCNVHQTLALYLISQHEEYINETRELFTQVYNLLLDYLKVSFISDIVERNIQLKVFVEAQHFLHSSIQGTPYTFTISNIGFSRLSPTQALRILTSLKIIDDNLFLTNFELAFGKLASRVNMLTYLDNALFLRVMADYLTLVNDSEPLEMGLFEPFEVINLSDYMNRIFNKYDMIATTNVTEKDLIKLNSLKDSDLRIKIANVIKGVDPVVLSRESRKPHGAFEISDMEIPVSFGRHRIYLCIPLKTGREIKEDSVPENVAYQIFRPFLDLKKCAVVFITAKKCSQNLMNYIKRLQNNFGWPIEVIQEKELAALLKVNNQL